MCCHLSIRLIVAPTDMNMFSDVELCTSSGPRDARLDPLLAALETVSAGRPSRRSSASVDKSGRGHAIHFDGLCVTCVPVCNILFAGCWEISEPAHKDIVQPSRRLVQICNYVVRLGIV